MSNKASAAREMAHEIVNTEDVDITHEIVDNWPAWEVYDWLELWGLTWDGESWVEADSPGQPDDPDAFREQLAAAMRYAVERHAEQQTFTGEPLLLHFIQTAAKCTTPAAIVATWLQNALALLPTHAERHARSIELQETFHQDVVAAVVALTMQTGQTPTAYGEQVQANPIALEVLRASNGLQGLR